MEGQSASEDSPLLPKTSQPNLGDVSKEPSSGTFIGDENGIDRVKTADDEEHQSNGEGGAARYEGMPEVKAKLKYILPAIGIGVRLISCIRQYGLTEGRSSLLLQTRPSLSPVMAKLAVTSRH